MNKPFLPSDVRARPPSEHVIRAAIAQARDLIEKQGRGAAALAREAWPDDRRTLEFLTRGAVVPASTTNTGLAFSAVADLLLASPTAASAALLRLAPPLRFDSVSVLVPDVIATASALASVAEGGVIPIRSMTLNGITLTPRKLAGGMAFTREMLGSSNAETLVRRAIIEAVGLATDAAMFSGTAGTTTAPGGLRFGIAETPTVGGNTFEDMRADLSALAAAVALVGGQQIAFVAANDTAVKIRLSFPLCPFPVLGTGGLASGVVMAVAIPALTVAADREPIIETSEEAVLHTEDTTPLPISTAGSPPTVAAPATSIWQVDAIGLRLIMHVDFGLRASGSIAWTSGVLW